ncbi:MAG TPA: hypothetical protein ENG69_01035 [Candidatus Korarchaeota archaeon]|nr:hypothetical protein [Candidatus Korarchaeota archaeon]
MKVRDALILAAFIIFLLTVGALAVLFLIKYLPLIAAAILALIIIVVIARILIWAVAAIAGAVGAVYFALRSQPEEELAEPIRLEDAREVGEEEG